MGFSRASQCVPDGSRLIPYRQFGLAPFAFLFLKFIPHFKAEVRPHESFIRVDSGH
jgi:hypothetical protein